MRTGWEDEVIVTSFNCVVGYGAGFDIKGPDVLLLSHQQLCRVEQVRLIADSIRAIPAKVAAYTVLYPAL